jgi:DNA (cytosine-5)-methyltransferase 1
LSKRPVAIDLFAGAGGLSLGLEQAGFDVLASVEIDPIHSCVHKYNFPNCRVIAKPIEQVSASCIRKAANLNSRDKIDLVAGGAPCQGFSLIGQRALDDPRNQLVKEFIRIVDELRPSYFLFENVKGLTVGKHKHFLDEIIQELESIGYQILNPWRVLNAKDFGVPQNRERLFLIGAKQGVTLPNYPKPEFFDAVNCAEALGDLPDAESFEELLESDEVPFKYIKRASGYSALMRCTNDNGWKFGYKRQWDSKLLTSSLRADHTDISRKRFKETLPGTVEKVSRFYKLSEDGVSNTLRAGTDSARGAFTSPRPIHYKHPRCITVREMARLHGFPDWFRFHETKWHGARQIGNAVPPPLAYALGRELIKLINPELEKPKVGLKLGALDLLRMDMSSASKYWGVENPISKRDRKSGNKKRKQSEIEALIVNNG